MSSYQYNYAYVDKYWYYGNQATDSAYVYLRSYYSQYNSSTAIGDTNALILPLITGLNAGYDQLSINARAASTSAAYSSDIVVGTTDTLGDLSTLIIIDTISVQGTSYADYDLDLSSISSSDRRLCSLPIRSQTQAIPTGITQRTLINLFEQITGLCRFI